MSMHKALTIAGSDSSGGAGIQADLKTFQEKNVYGMTALTVIVAMNQTTAGTIRYSRSILIQSAPSLQQLRTASVWTP